MGNLLQCFLQVLPQFLTCVITKQQEANAKGQKGPVDALLQLLADLQQPKQ